MNLLNILKNVFVLFCSRSFSVIISSKEVWAFIQGWRHQGGSWGAMAPHFVWQKKKKGIKKNFKAKTIKRLSPR